MIAHRLHTILTCDKVLMLEKGRVVGFGAPDELKANCPEFAELVSKTGFDEDEASKTPQPHADEPQPPAKPSILDFIEQQPQPEQQPATTQLPKPVSSSSSSSSDDDQQPQQEPPSLL